MPGRIDTSRSLTPAAKARVIIDAGFRLALEPRTSGPYVPRAHYTKATWPQQPHTSVNPPDPSWCWGAPGRPARGTRRSFDVELCASLGDRRCDGGVGGTLGRPGATCVDFGGPLGARDESLDLIPVLGTVGRGNPVKAPVDVLTVDGEGDLEVVLVLDVEDGADTVGDVGGEDGTLPVEAGGGGPGVVAHDVLLPSGFQACPCGFLMHINIYDY
nr:MAG TPA: hypothetical protein [Caudoviricetes sp.]